MNIDIKVLPIKEMGALWFHESPIRMGNVIFAPLGVDPYRTKWVENPRDFPLIRHIAPYRKNTGDYYTLKVAVPIERRFVRKVFAFRDDVEMPEWGMNYCGNIVFFVNSCPEKPFMMIHENVFFEHEADAILAKEYMKEKMGKDYDDANPSPLDVLETCFPSNSDDD